MSFAKAKLQRFNDIKVCTPSPAKYNVSAQKKLKFGLFSNEKFTKKIYSPPCSETGSIQSTPCFQTPNVPKKKKFLGLSSSKPKYNDLEELKEKIVECNNKDVFIKELTDQIEDMKEKISRLESEKEFCDEIKENYEQKIDLIKSTHQTEFSGLNTKIIELHSELKKIQSEYKKVKESNCLEIAELFSHIAKFEDLHTRALEEYKNKLEKMHFEYSQKMQEAKTHNNQEIAKLTKQLNDKSSKIKKLLDEKLHYETLLDEKNAKIKQLEENFQDVNVLTEIQLQEKISEIEKTWREKFHQQQNESEVILKECQEISEFSVVQSEFEKNHLKNLLKEKEIAYDSLKREYDEFVNNYKSLDLDTVQLHQELSESQIELKKLKSQKHAYEISLTTFKDTIEVLKTRLINSDHAVEQLKDELVIAENKILNYENQIAELTARLSEAQITNEELEMQYESTSKLMQNQVKTIEMDLLKKVGVLEKQLKSVKNKAKDEKELFSEVIEHHYEQQLLTNKAQELIVQSNNLISKLESDNVQLETTNLELQVQLENAKTKLREEIEDGAEIRKKYIEKSGKYDELSHQFEQLLQELDRLKDKNCDLEKKFDSVKKSSKKLKYTSEDKENLGSPIRLLRVESPGPLKEKN